MSMFAISVIMAVVALALAKPFGYFCTVEENKVISRIFAVVIAVAYLSLYFFMINTYQPFFFREYWQLNFGR